jgi:hypothetical protein
MFDDIRNELSRLNAADVQLESDTRTNPGDIIVVKITIGERSCCVHADGLLVTLQSLPDGAGETAIEVAIASSASHAEGWATC